VWVAVDRLLTVHKPKSPPQELADLPFASVLRTHDGGLEPEGDYDGLHFDRRTFAEEEAGHARFLECAFTGAALEGGRFNRARFQDVWIRDTRMVAVEIVESDWQDSAVLASVLAGVQAYNAIFRRVTFQNCKLDSVNFRGATLVDVTFADCILRDVDFSMAKLTRTAFPGSRLTETRLTKATFDKVDLRGAQIGIADGVESLRGAIIDSSQLIDLAPLLAQCIGLTVE
jgi:uncharacterized protein YjbI with pentapeptide repeats